MAKKPKPTETDEALTWPTGDLPDSVTEILEKARARRDERDAPTVPAQEPTAPATETDITIEALRVGLPPLLDLASRFLGMPPDTILSHRLTEHGIIVIVDYGVKGGKKFTLTAEQMTKLPEGTPIQ